MFLGVLCWVLHSSISSVAARRWSSRIDHQKQFTSWGQPIPVAPALCQLDWLCITPVQGRLGTEGFLLTCIFEHKWLTIIIMNLQISMTDIIITMLCGATFLLCNCLAKDNIVANCSLKCRFLFTRIFPTALALCTWMTDKSGLMNDEHQRVRSYLWCGPPANKIVNNPTGHSQCNKISVKSCYIWIVLFNSKPKAIF